ncbi:hypothetical protein AA310_13750 [Arthrobacter sp. YC-RL1]|nr:hypothetical protein ATC04_04305 [Arthrobacter sp. YC-RL1]KLI88809.1 hypothetical protein AA310_13750 [Arthrobacter sp. YC-RL1]
MRRIRIRIWIVDGSFALFVQGNFYNFIQHTLEHRLQRVSYTTDDTGNCPSKAVDNGVKNGPDGSTDDAHNTLNQWSDQFSEIQSKKFQIHSRGRFSVDKTQEASHTSSNIRSALGQRQCKSCFQS